ncbi:unnamed protein product [Symbiodinium microadriaticum]|nr:unnamed protein product [Symbiodinium microadriaticum]
MTLLTSSLYSSGYVHVVGGRSRPPEAFASTLLLGKVLAFMQRRAMQFRVLARGLLADVLAEEAKQMKALREKTWNKGFCKGDFRSVDKDLQRCKDGRIVVWSKDGNRRKDLEEPTFVELDGTKNRLVKNISVCFAAALLVLCSSIRCSAATPSEEPGCAADTDVLLQQRHESPISRGMQLAELIKLSDDPSAAKSEIDVPSGQVVDINIGTNLSPMKSVGDNFLLQVDPLPDVCDKLNVWGDPHIYILDGDKFDLFENGTHPIFEFSGQKLVQPKQKGPAEVDWELHCGGPLDGAGLAAGPFHGTLPPGTGMFSSKDEDYVTSFEYVNEKRISPRMNGQHGRAKSTRAGGKHKFQTNQGWAKLGGTAEVADFLEGLEGKQCKQAFFLLHPSKMPHAPRRRSCAGEISEAEGINAQIFEDCISDVCRGGEKFAKSAAEILAGSIASGDDFCAEAALRLQVLLAGASKCIGAQHQALTQRGDGRAHDTLNCPKDFPRGCYAHGSWSTIQCMDVADVAISPPPSQVLFASWMLLCRFRPPLALAVMAAAAKLVTTAWVMDEPLLKSSAALNQEVHGLRTKVLRLLLRLLFLALALSQLLEDFFSATGYLGHLQGFQKMHALALMLAFSPNTVAAVAGTWMIEVKMSWTHRLFLQPDMLGVISDAIALVYWGVLGFVYVFPLFLFGTTHGVLGFCVMCYAFTYDLITFPWRLVTGHMAEIWVAVPVIIAGALLAMMYVLVMMGYYSLVKFRYPDIAQSAPAGGDKEKIFKAFKDQMPHQVAARIFGAARDVGLAKLGGSPTGELEMDSAPFTKVEEVQDGEKCILNNEGLMLALAGKVLGCLSMPMVQLCVVIASQVYLGHGAWEAANTSFQERTWDHYFDHSHPLRWFGTALRLQPFKLLWMYI